jgi:hypothetical protein
MKTSTLTVNIAIRKWCMPLHLRPIRCSSWLSSQLLQNSQNFIQLSGRKAQKFFCLLRNMTLSDNHMVCFFQQLNQAVNRLNFFGLERFSRHLIFALRFRFLNGGINNVNGIIAMLTCDRNGVIVIAFSLVQVYRCWKFIIWLWQ